jgi:hypothetical protein
VTPLQLNNIPSCLNNVSEEQKTNPTEELDSRVVISKKKNKRHPPDTRQIELFLFELGDTFQNHPDQRKLFTTYLKEETPTVMTEDDIPSLKQKVKRKYTKQEKGGDILLLSTSKLLRDYTEWTRQKYGDSALLYNNIASFSKTITRLMKTFAAIDEKFVDYPLVYHNNIRHLVFDWRSWNELLFRFNSPNNYMKQSQS